MDVHSYCKQSDLIDTTSTDEENDAIFIKKIDEFDIKLIEKVKTYPCLYAHKQPNEANVNEAWTSIASSLNTSVQECQKTWTHLRKEYPKERKKREMRGIGSVKDLSLYDFMKWIDPFVRRRRSKSSKSMTSNILTNISSSSLSADNVINIQNCENTPNVQDSAKNTVNVQNSENTVNVQNSENTVDVQNSENTVDMQTYESTGDVLNSQRAVDDCLLNNNEVNTEFRSTNFQINSAQNSSSPCTSTSVFEITSDSTADSYLQATRDSQSEFERLCDEISSDGSSTMCNQLANVEGDTAHTALSLPNCMHGHSSTSLSESDDETEDLGNKTKKYSAAELHKQANKQLQDITNRFINEMDANTAKKIEEGNNFNEENHIVGKLITTTLKRIDSVSKKKFKLDICNIIFNDDHA